MLLFLQQDVGHKGLPASISLLWVGFVLCIHDAPYCESQKNGQHGLDFAADLTFLFVSGITDAATTMIQWSLWYCLLIFANCLSTWISPTFRQYLITYQSLLKIFCHFAKTENRQQLTIFLHSLPVCQQLTLPAGGEIAHKCHNYINTEGSPLSFDCLFYTRKNKD